MSAMTIALLYAVGLAAALLLAGLGAIHWARQYRTRKGSRPSYPRLELSTRLQWTRDWARWN